MYTWGRNLDGQLGHSGRKEASIPTLVPDVRAAQIACGADFTLALHADGQVFGWGSNASAQVKCLVFLRFNIFFEESHHMTDFVINFCNCLRLVACHKKSQIKD